MEKGILESLEQMAALKASITAYDDIRTLCMSGFSKSEIKSHCLTMINALIEQSKNLKPNEPETVTNGEQTQEFCVCDADYTLDVAICSVCGKDKR